ncbi:hypothetical protein [Streptomyces niveus]|uniref:hypothetical protein n=1 Tax=Streptomyces niveus TaxID=193462 RepID=UPI003444B966
MPQTVAYLIADTAQRHGHISVGRAPAVPAPGTARPPPHLCPARRRTPAGARPEHRSTLMHDVCEDDFDYSQHTPIELPVGPDHGLSKLLTATPVSLVRSYSDPNLQRGYRIGGRGPWAMSVAIRTGR